MGAARDEVLKELPSVDPARPFEPWLRTMVREPNIQRGGVAQLGWGMRVPGFAVLALPDKVGPVAL